VSETRSASQVLRSHGYRNTTQRQLVLAAVTALRHATPEQIHTYVTAHDGTVNLSTVYRVLDVLESVGLVRHAHIDSGSPTFHATDSPPHLHFRCRECGVVVSLPAAVADEFAANVARQIGFQVDMSHAGIHGLCGNCQEER